MAEFPALPFFTDAYLADTRHLTTEEHGTYLLLLMCAWRTRGCQLPDDDRFLARITGLTPRRWARIKPAVSMFFDIDDGVWRQKRLTKTYQTVTDKVARNRENGARGGRAKAMKNKEVRSAIDKPVLAKRISECAAKTLPTKTKPKQNQQATRTDENAVLSPEERQILVAAGLPENSEGRDELALWRSWGIDLLEVALPVVERIAGREKTKRGKLPHSLAYYRDAVKEAADTAPKIAAITEKRVFDARTLDDWRLFLGDANSRFRGDWVARTWHITKDNPHFIERPLGPNPKHAFNPHIPTEIYREYGSLWGWLAHETLTEAVGERDDT